MGGSLVVSVVLGSKLPNATTLPFTTPVPLPLPSTPPLTHSPAPLMPLITSISSVVIIIFNASVIPNNVTVSLPLKYPSLTSIRWSVVFIIMSSCIVSDSFPPCRLHTQEFDQKLWMLMPTLGSVGSSFSRQGPYHRRVVLRVYQRGFGLGQLSGTCA